MNTLQLKNFSLLLPLPQENSLSQNGRKGYAGSPNKNIGAGSLPSTNIFSQGGIALFWSIPLIEEFRNICAS